MSAQMKLDELKAARLYDYVNENYIFDYKFLLYVHSVVNAPKS